MKSVGARGSSVFALRGLILIVLCAVIVVVAGAGTAKAVRTRSYTGVSFGPEGTQSADTFQKTGTLAVDQSTGDVYVVDTFASRIYKFDSAGEPLAFSSTGTNWISAEAGEMASARIAIAPPGSPGGTAGDIYFTKTGPYSPPGSAPPSVVVYAPSGEELTSFGPLAESASCGIATNSAGHIFGMFGDRIFEYVPSSNPPTESDLVQASGVLGLGFCRIAADDVGNIYISELNSPEFQGLYRLEGVEDRSLTKISSEGAYGLAVNSLNGVLLASGVSEVTEYSAGGATKLGDFGAGRVEGSGVGIYPATEEVYVTNPNSGRVDVFGPPLALPGVSLGDPVFSDPARASLHGSVDPEGIPVTECKFEYGLTTTSEYEHAVSCSPFPSSITGNIPVEAAAGELDTDGQTYRFRLRATNANGTNSSPEERFETPASVDTAPATSVTETTATLNGRVFPNGRQYSVCEFEYGPVSLEGFQSTAPCNPAAAAVPPDSSFHPVAAELSELLPDNVTYRYRLKATNLGGTVFGKSLKFTTSGEPQISEVKAVDADQHAALLRALVNPSGFDTSYKVEWGPTDAYGTDAASGVIEADQGPTMVEAKIEGLNVDTAYHFHVVVSNVAGEKVSIDRRVEALNGCGLPQMRCLELVSPRDPGPTASPGHGAGLLEFEQQFQAADRSGALAYVSEGGFPDATRGAEVFYRGIRSGTEWSTTQVAPPVTVLDETQGEHSNSSRNLTLSSELSCGLTETNQNIPGSTPAMRQVVEAGGENLFRMNGDGSYTPVTTSPPENIQLTTVDQNAYFFSPGMSQDCRKVYFSSVYRYPGTEAVGNLASNGHSLYLYEWSEATGLHAVGFVPSPSGTEVPVAAEPGNSRGSKYAERNAVAADGSQIFFTAERQVGKNVGEVGEGITGLFVRRDGVTHDVSLSETSVPDVSPEYQWASPDGSKVFFTAPAGLTAESSAGGTDLYEYDLAKQPSEQPLKDLSVNRIEPSADVAGIVGASEDGSRIYFAASGRMVSGQGLSAGENRDAETYSLYLLDGEDLRFVATVSSGGKDTSLNHTSTLLISNSATVTSQTTPEGRYLLFESEFPATSYEGGGVREVYLFDAGAPSEAISCLSCRPYGETAVRPASNFHPLLAATKANQLNPSTAPRTLTLVDGSPTVTFASVDPLASGAVEGRVGLYEWSHGQLFLLAAESGAFQSSNGQGQEDLPGNQPVVRLMGFDADGSDLYFSTPTSQNWENTTAPYFVYDARIGGGFAPPPAKLAPCNPIVEGQCQAKPAESPRAAPGAATSNFIGPSNPKPKQCKKNFVRKKTRCVKKSRHNKRGKHKKKRHRGSGKLYGTGKRGAGK
jgi:hypothetical protein